MRFFRTILLAAAALAAGWCATAPAWADLRGDLLIDDGNSAASTSKDAVTEKTFLSTAESYLIGIVAMIALIVFLWIGYEMLTAEGDPERFKKSQKALSYAVVGLALIPLAYTLVKLATSVNF